MVSLQEPLQATTKCGAEQISSPRISFSSEFLDENNFISICPKRDGGERDQKSSGRNADFEFLSGGLTTSNMMMSADELFLEGKLLPSWHVEKLATLKTAAASPAEAEAAAANHDKDRRISWFLDDDPSPRPPTCTVLWKELLRLKKQRPSTLSPSSSTSSSSSENSTDERKKGGGEKNKATKSAKKGLERTKSTNVRIRPMINVPICTARNASLPPLFPLRRSSSRLES